MEFIRTLHADHMARAGDDDLFRSVDFTNQLVHSGYYVRHVLITDYDQGRDMNLFEPVRNSRLWQHNNAKRPGARARQSPRPADLPRCDAQSILCSLIHVAHRAWT